MEFIKLAQLSSLGPERIQSFKVLGRHIGLVRAKDGELFATEISCKHQNADLCGGRLEGDVVTCPRHFWKYDLVSGECLNQSSAPLRRHAMRIEGDDIFVSVRPEAPEDVEEEAFPELEIRPRD